MSKIASRHRPWTAICLTALLLSSVGMAACGGSSGTTSSSAGASSASTPASSPAPAQAQTTSANAPAKKTATQQSSLPQALRNRLSKAAATPKASNTVKTTASRSVNAFKKAFAAFTGCLRTNGVSIPSAAGKSPVPSLAGVKTNTPQFRAAAAKCRAALLASLRRSRLPLGAR